VEAWQSSQDPEVQPLTVPFPYQESAPLLDEHDVLALLIAPDMQAPSVPDVLSHQQPEEEVPVAPEQQPLQVSVPASDEEAKLVVPLLQLQSLTIEGEASARSNLSMPESVHSAADRSEVEEERKVDISKLPLNEVLATLKNVEDYNNILASHQRQYGGAEPHKQDPSLLSPQHQVNLINELFPKMEAMYGNLRLERRVRKVDMERIRHPEVALRIIYDSSEKMAKRNYYWLRDIIMGKVQLSVDEFVHFFRSALKEARQHSPRVYRYFL
jgi:hypothetical protein